MPSANDVNNLLNSDAYSLPTSADFTTDYYASLLMPISERPLSETAALATGREYAAMGPLGYGRPMPDLGMWMGGQVRPAGQGPITGPRPWLAKIRDMIAGPRRKVSGEAIVNYRVHTMAAPYRYLNTAEF